MAWYLSILTLAGYAALKHDEIFIGCIMGTLALLYLKANWSFDQNWEKRAHEYALTGSESACIFQLDNESVTEIYQDIRITVPWREIHEYSMNSERLILHYAIKRGFILPMRFITPEAREFILTNLESRKIQDRSKTISQSGKPRHKMT
jgi:hypothetical protein